MKYHSGGMRLLGRQRRAHGTRATHCHRSLDVVVGQNELAEDGQHLHGQALALRQPVALRVQNSQFLHGTRERSKRQKRQRRKGRRSSAAQVFRTCRALNDGGNSSMTLAPTLSTCSERKSPNSGGKVITAFASTLNVFKDVKRQNPGHRRRI
jgi:hypothetical protein